MMDISELIDLEGEVRAWAACRETFSAYQYDLGIRCANALAEIIEKID